LDWKNSIGIRLAIIGFLILLLIIPSEMISSMVDERQTRSEEAIGEVTSKWAAAQTIAGPVLTVPYEKTYKDEKGKVISSISYIQLLPEKLNINGVLTPEIRRRGIYKAVLYTSRIKLAGSYSFEKINVLDVKPEKIHWQDSFIAVAIPDMRGIKDTIVFTWNDQKFQFEPGIKEGDELFDSGVSVKLPLDAATIAKRCTFSLKLALNGSEAFNLLPLGQTTEVHLSSSWSDPSFDGAFLPEKHQVTPQGFSATWKILDLNRNFPQQWLGTKANKEGIFASDFGVKLISPVNEYTKTSRSIKYNIMFIALTFLVFFLVEIFNQKRIHPIQYLLIGMALCLFYLLLLSLSEHLGFEPAYLIASLSVIALITFYVHQSLTGKGLTIATATLLTTLFTFLYILLQNQDYALLIGSIGLFVILAVVMFLSRKVNWYQINFKA
jgi:inner membrane protein